LTYKLEERLPVDVHGDEKIDTAATETALDAAVENVEKV